MVVMSFLRGRYQSIGRILYRGYERMLTKEVLSATLPKHIAIIMDGNRRYARRMGEEEFMGHVYGADTMEQLLHWCNELEIERLTLYAFSTENFKRTSQEREELFRMMQEKFNELAEDEQVHQNRLRIQVIGRRDLIPEDVQTAIENAEKATEKYDSFRLYVALAYGGRREIVDSVRAIAHKIKKGDIGYDDVDQELIASHLYANDHPQTSNVDLIIRTGGELRTSNFLPWQISEAAAYFCTPYWPGFRKIDFLRAIRTYQMRETERRHNDLLRAVRLMYECGMLEVVEAVRMGRKVSLLARKEMLDRVPVHRDG